MTFQLERQSFPLSITKVNTKNIKIRTSYLVVMDQSVFQALNRLIFIFPKQQLRCAASFKSSSEPNNIRLFLAFNLEKKTFKALPNFVRVLFLQLNLGCFVMDQGICWTSSKQAIITLSNKSEIALLDHFIKFTVKQESVIFNQVQHIPVPSLSHP